MQYVFLDSQSTTPVLPEARRAMEPYWAEAFGSPASLHRFGLRARDALAKARQQFAALVNAESPEEILFTSSGTESANLAVQGAASASRRRGNHLVLSAVEHPAVLNSAEFLERHGFTCTRVGVDAEGSVDPHEVAAALTEQTILICLQQANPDVGTLQPIAEVGRLAAERGIPFFVDAVASGGWHPIDVQAAGISLLSLAPHRFYGPKGVGILYRQKRARLSPVIHGGIQEGGLRAGTENVPAIVGAGVAAEIAGRELTARRSHTERLQHLLWERLSKRIGYIRLNGPAPGPRRLSTNLNISIEFVEGEGMLLALDMAGVAVASGTACLSKSLKISHVLAAMGLDHSLARSSLLLSLGRENTEKEMDFVVEAMARTVQKLRGLSALWDDFERGRIDSVISPGRLGTPEPHGAAF